MKRRNAIVKIASVLLCVILAACNRQEINTLSDTIIQTEATVATAAVQQIMESVPEPEKQISGQIRNPDFDGDIPKEAQETILAYLDTWYESLSSLEKQDFTELFDLENIEGREGYALNELELEFLLDMRLQSPVDLTFDNAQYGITLWRIFQTKEEDDILRVAVIEDSSVYFSFQEDISSTMVTYHSFTLIPSKDGWKIQRHVDRQDVTYAVNQTYQALKEDIKDEELSDIWINEALGNIKKQLYDEAQSGKEMKAISREEITQGIEELPEFDHAYHRESAVKYAQIWAGGNSLLRNEDWPDYDMYGGDCNNFTSQCLYAGGIPMDTYGAQWKWYSDVLTGAGIPAGRSASWGGVDEFYSYCTANDGYGLVAIPDANDWIGEPGDILQFYALDKWRHSVLITDTIHDEEGNTIDYLISSHSADRRNYPASAYMFPESRLIKILGWNEN